MARTPDQIRKSLTTTVKALREDNDLSKEGRARQLARAYVNASEEMKAVRAVAARDREDRGEALHRRMFGNPTAGDPASAINFRDALERAERITDAEEARNLLDRAHRVGDEALGKAIAMRALDKAKSGIGKNWIPVINEWAAVNGVDAELTELSTLMQPAARAMEDLQYALSRPSEVAHMAGFGAIERAAKQAQADDDAEPPAFDSSRPGETSGKWNPLAGAGVPEIGGGDF